MLCKYNPKSENRKKVWIDKCTIENFVIILGQICSKKFTGADFKNGKGTI